jgi:hypothetical protein
VKAGNMFAGANAVPNPAVEPEPINPRTASWSNDGIEAVALKVIL